MKRSTSKAQTKTAGLRKEAPPPEPHIAYPEPHLSSSEMLALIRGKTFSTTNHKGNIMPPGAPHVGLFFDDTRYLSQMDLCVNGAPPVVLSCGTECAYASRIELTMRGSLEAKGLDLPVNTIYVHREQLLERDTLFDLVHFENFYQARAKLRVEIAYDADFMDIFQVRGMVRGKSGHYFAPIATDDSLSFLYEGLDNLVRTTTVRFAPCPKRIEGKIVHWQIDLDPLGKASIAITVRAHAEPKQTLKQALDAAKSPQSIPSRVKSAQQNGLRKPLARLRVEFEQWHKDCTRFRSNNGIFDAIMETSTEDFYSLQMPDTAGTAIAGGVPWFATLFGRDSLISSFQSLILNPSLAQGTLRVLASYQGRETRKDRDEEPGKILHEMRSGEMTETGEVAFGMNYGSVDATALFLILISEYYRWAGDEDLVRGLAKSISLAVKWLLTYAAIDGTGLIEYCRKSPKGLFNQGWKDSGDANMHADGTIAQPPIALVEVQGYAVRALTESAELLKFLGDEELSGRAMERAHKIRGLLDPMFWMEERNYYAMALDKDHRQLKVIASNPGHLLFSGAVTQERASSIVETLLDSGLFSGWGIRTLSECECTYNPMSYHRGSVWPHDNSLIVHGMARYGFHKEAARIISAMYDAALHFREYRLPELFCGIRRKNRDEPVHYPVSCSPQAWASGAPLLLLTSALGLRPNALRKELCVVNPHLPEFLNNLHLENFRIGNSRIALEFQRQGDRTSCSVLGIEGEPVAVSVSFNET